MKNKRVCGLFDSISVSGLAELDYSASLWTFGVVNILINFPGQVFLVKPQGNQEIIVGKVETVCFCSLRE